MKVLLFLVSLSLLVVTHELGHLCFAKLFHTRVRRFYVFFNPIFSILKAKKFDGKWHFLFFNKETPESWDEKNLRPEDQDNTLWGLGWVPLGGFCDVAGMVDETKDSGDLESEPQPWEYRTKPRWQRLLIISGGVLVNFISALIIYAGVFAHWGTDELPLRNAKLGYEYHQILLDEGFQNGDIIYAFDGVEQYDYAEAGQTLVLHTPKEVTVMRGIGGGCDEEVVRVVKAMPKWKPGKQDGKPVRVNYMMPFNFKLDTPQKTNSLVGSIWEGTGTGTKDNVTYTWHSVLQFNSENEGLLIEKLVSQKKNADPVVEFENVAMDFEYAFDGKKTGAITPKNGDGTYMDELPPEGFILSEDGKTIVLNFYTATDDTGIKFVTYTKR